MTKYLMVLAVIVLGYSGCKDKGTKSNFEIAISGNVGSEALSLTNKTYTDGGKEFYFTQLKFFVAHVKLVKPDDTEVEIASTGFFDLKDGNWQKLKAEVDPGTYKGINFYVGLDPQQNAEDPTDHGEDEVLGPKDDMYWGWLKHRFVNLEGKAGLTGQNYPVGLAYHVGTDACYREVKLSGTEFTLNDGTTTSINLNVDLLKVFTGSNAIDMLTQPGTQSESNDIDIANQFADNFAQAFSYSK